MAVMAAVAVTLGVSAQAASASAPLTPGDVVVYRVGAGSTALSGAATPVFLDEYEPSGKLVESIAMPTTASGANKPLRASGTATSEGLLTLSGNGEYVMATGYDTASETADVGESEAAVVPRTVARVSASGEVNTTTALTDFANKNNPRGATSSDGTQIWVSGAGKSTTGGVHYTTLGSSTSTLMSAGDTNARAVTDVDGQLYTSADPTKEGISIATVGDGLPTSAGQTTANLPFASAPSEPYAFALLTLGMGVTPDTMYVADNGGGAIVKYGLSGGAWNREGSVTVPGVTGVTANDADGVVSIFATTAGTEGKTGTLYEITDTSGAGGTLSGTATEIAKATANEAFRGVAFAPGTTIGSGGPPPPPAPTIITAESSLAAALEDPTNATLGVHVEEAGVEPNELTVTASSSNTSVAPQGGIDVTGSGAERTLEVTPAAVGESAITLTVEGPGGTRASATVTYGVSAYQGDPSDRYYAGAGNGSTAIDVGDGYMIVGDDETNVLRLYHERVSGESVKTFDFTDKLPFGATEMDIESSARSGDTLYWMGSLSNSKKGKLEPARDALFAATITGSGANTELTYVGSYTHLREDLIEWDEANGNPLGFAASTESGVPSNQTDGFNVEGLEFAAGSTSTAYVAFRAPIEPPNDRNDALLVPVTDFSALVEDGNPGSTKATFGTPLEWNLGGLGIREIRRNAAGEFLVIAGTSDDSNSSFGLYTWDGSPAEEPALSDTPVAAVAEGAWESIVSVPEPIADGDQIELLEDNGDTDWYEDGLDSKDGLPPGLQKDLGRIFTIELPAPAAPGAPQLASGANANADGQFTLSWKPSHSLGIVTYALQHENADGGWSTVASGLTATEYAFTSTSPEGEGTWTYRVIADDGSGESPPSEASGPVKVDETAPNAPLLSATRAPDYAGGGGWYKDGVTVSFTGDGDPALSDGSPGSGVDPASIPAAQTFSTSGSYTVSGTVMDLAGNVSQAGALTVQVDATPPTVEVNCPAFVALGGTASATVSAADGQSGLASDPSGTVPIDTSRAGAQTIARTAIDNVGHETTASCTTQVGYTKVVSTTIAGRLLIKGTEAVMLTSGARVDGAVTVKPGGVLDVEGATVSGAVKASNAKLLRLCGATLGGSLKATGSTGPVVVGEGGGECPANALHTVTLKGNAAGVTVDENSVQGTLKVTGNAGGTLVVDNLIGGSLTVSGNSGPVVDRPNKVHGRSRLQ